MLGVSGTNEEREAASKQVKGYGLALNLLGTYLQKAFGGDIQQLDRVELSKADEREGSHARHIMERYEGFLGESPEVSIARLLGLFDRFTPKFVKKYADFHAEMGRAFSEYLGDVQDRTFPAKEHSIDMEAEEWQAFLKSL